MSAAMKLAYKRDVNDPLVTFCPDTLLMRGDKGANIIELTVMDGSSPADLSGHTAVVMFQRPGDSDKIRCPGSISGNVISVTLLGDCYAYSGQYYASLVLDASGFTRTMLRLAGHVENSGDGPVVDPTGTIPGYDDIARIYAELEASLEESETATNSANAAAQNANTAAGSANASAGAANTAAGKANDATSRANTAAASIEGMTVEASDVAYNQPATATVTDVEGHKHIAFGLRQGNPGEVPNITFTVQTGEPGTDVVLEQSGTPDAPIVDLTIPRGDTGDGDVNSVDAVSPNTNGDVILSAVRYAAQTLQTAQQLQALTNISGVGYVSQTLTDEQQQQARANIGIIADTYSGAGVHNAIYRGANLGTSVTSDQWSAIQAGTFTDLYIGDYWRINEVNWRIAAFDYYYNTGDSLCTNHHIVMVPDTSLYGHVMNDIATTDGGYIGSKMRTAGLATALTMVQNAFGSEHILAHRNYFSNAVSNGIPSGQAWADSLVDLMSEHNIFGGKLFEAGNSGAPVPLIRTVDMTQFPLFVFRPDLVANKQTFWLRDVASASQFSCLYAEGRATFDDASGPYGVRPAFCIYSPAS